MTEIVFLLSLACPPTVIKNYTNTWTEQDIEILRGAEVRCQELYKKSPCVKRFVKKTVDAYQVICGAEKELRNER